MEDGIYRDLSIGDYHDNTTHISASSIKQAKKSLKDFEYYFKKDTTRKPHFDFGNVFEVALLEPLKLLEKVAIFDHTKRPEIEKNFNSTKNKAWKSDFFEENNDKYIVNHHDNKESYTQIEEMIASCKANAVINKAVSKIDYQVSAFWTDEDTGLKLKTRPDVIKSERNMIIDVKTCLDASPHAFIRDACKYDYPLQAIMQINGCLKSGLLDGVDAYYWLAVQKTAPYHAELYEFQKEDQESMNAVYHHVLAKIKRAKEENLFPGFSDRSLNKYGVLPFELPPYYTNEII